MKKMKNLITGMLLVLALGVFTACGENKDRNADETGTMKEDVEKRDDNKENTEDQNRDMTDKKRRISGGRQGRRSGYGKRDA